MTIPPRLPYAAIRTQLQSGDLLLCCGSAPFSKMIQAATGSEFSHIALLWHVADLGRWLVFESIESLGVRVVPLRHYLTNYNNTGKPYGGRLFIGRHRAFPSEGAQRLAFRQRGADLLGSAYDNRQIAAIALRIVSAKLGLNPRDARDDNLYICSEYVAECYGAVGLAVPYDPAGYVAPKDFVAWADVSVLWEIDTSQGEPYHGAPPPTPA